jgi:SAM-dependent methyltransferase
MSEMLTRKIQNDFDRIALLGEEKGWNHNSHYHRFLLKQLPNPCDYYRVLEIGCGTGEFSRLLAERCKEVVAVDLSPNMIEAAKKQSKHFTNIDFQAADILKWEFPVQQFDAIASLATVHHLPLEELLPKLKTALKPGGKLLILDLLENENFGDMLNDVIAVPANWIFQMLRNSGSKPTPEAVEAMRQHIITDKYLTLKQAKEIYNRSLTGAIVQRHLFWRYSVVWEKP